MIHFSETVRVHPRSSGQLLIGVPTLHRYDHLRKCLLGILASAPDDSEIVVIDNGGSFQNDISSRIQVLRPPCNLGAPASWNLIGDLADGREFMIFNDDIIPAPQTISNMRNAPGWMVCSYAFGSFLVRQLLWEKVGRFDEFLWPMYWEDTDYQARMRLAVIEDRPESDAIPATPFRVGGNPPPVGSENPTSLNGISRIEGGLIIVTDSGIEHLGGGSQTKQHWMEPWIDRTRMRFLRKWNQGDNRTQIKLCTSSGDVTLSRLPFDGSPDDPLGTYWDECHRHGWEPYMDAMDMFAKECETVLQLGLHVGRFTLPFLRSPTVKHVHCYDWTRLAEWDYMMRLDEQYGRRLTLHSCYDPRRPIPEVDLLFIDEANSSAIAKRMILKQVSRVRKFVGFLGPCNATCPARDEFMQHHSGWSVAHHNNGLCVFRRD